jgi:hypothetical protein
MSSRFPVVAAALSVLALFACSQSQSTLPTATASSQSCNNFEPPLESLHGVYDIPSDASGSSAECATDEALASGQEIVGHGDMPFFWQSLDALSMPISMPLAIASSPPNVPEKFKKAIPPGAPVAKVSSGTLPLTVVAAYRQSNGVVDTFQGDADSSSVLNDMLTQWEKAGSGPNADAAVEQPDVQPYAIDPKVWMELGSYHGDIAIDASGHVSGRADGGYHIYRLNTRNPRYDYFLITLDGINQASFNNCKYEFPRYYCQWINRGVRLSAYLAKDSNPRAGLGEVIDAAPKSEVTTGTYTSEEGAELKAELNCSVGDSAGAEDLVRPGPVSERVLPQDAECGVTAGGTYSTKVTVTWNVKSRTVHNYTAPNGTTADWDMTFAGWPDGCKNNGLPEDSKSTGDFGAAAIVRIPRDQIYNVTPPRLMVVLQLQGRTIGWDYLLSCSDAYQYTSAWSQTPIFQLPTFSVDANATKGLTVPPGGSAKFQVISQRTDLLTGIPASLWLVKDGAIKKFSDVGIKMTPDNETGLAIARKTWDIMPRVQTWTITAGATAPKTTYVLYVDTVPGGETDSVRLRPIAVPLTIQ